MKVNLANELLIGDSLRINQILMNLVSNAFKFTDSGGSISINVTESAHRNHTVFVKFEVADTGAGMDAEMLNRLFHPFEQENTETFRKHGELGPLAKRETRMDQNSSGLKKRRCISLRIREIGRASCRERV